MSFNSDENKGLLWELLQEGGFFKNIRPTLMKSVKGEFENTMMELEQTSRNESLIDKNKFFINKFTYKLKSLNSTPFNSNIALNINEVDEIYTSQNIQKQRQEEMNNDFNFKKQEMDSMLHATKPADVNFSMLGGDDEPIQNIDHILEQTIQQRNIDVQNINTSYDQKKATKWLGNEKKITFQEEPENIVIKSNEFSSKEASATSIDSITTNSTIFNNDESTQILDILKKILTNQEIILSKLGDPQPPDDTLASNHDA